MVVKTRMRPIHNPVYVAVFHRISLCRDARVPQAQDAQERPMNIIHVAGIILFITDAMLPEPPLPNPAFTTLDTTCRAAFTTFYVPMSVKNLP